MTKRLVLVHGRAQENKDSVALKQEWIEAFKRGLAKSGLQLPIAESDIKFPYYGQTLFDLVRDVAADKVAEVVVRGAAQDRAREQFLESVLNEVLAKAGVTEAQVSAMAGGDVVERGLQNKTWVLALLRAIDQHVPGASGASIALITNDVYQYVNDPNTKARIDDGVKQAMSNDGPTVVVGHSLGTVVCYSLLRKAKRDAGWQVPLLLTLGSPLGIGAIKESLAPIGSPECVKSWVNAYDPADAVALYALDQSHFRVNPSIENLAHVQNSTDNRHGISGYLDDKIVAKRIYEALTH
jgi:hypothetical protein